MEPYNRVIHKGLLGDDGSTAAVCGNPPGALDSELQDWILSPWLHDEITCLDCLTRLGLQETVSRGRLLRNNLAARLKIAFFMIDAIYWNQEVRQPHEPKINPDPDGYLASQFLDLTQEFDKLMRPALEGMKKHEAKFGWPAVIDINDG